MRLPNVVIAGAPRCGTTSIFEWLSSHPDVCVSSRKETGFFLDRDCPPAGPPGVHVRRGLEAYGRFFAHCGERTGVKVILEATPDYFDRQTAITAVPRLPSAPTIVLVLRRPSARIYSSFQFCRNNLALLPKRMTFGEFIGSTRVGADERTTAVLRQTLDQTRYARHVSKWIASAGRERVCLYLFEDLRSDPAGFMRRLSNRIGIEAEFWERYDFKRINASYRVRSPGVHRLVRRLAAAAPALVRNDLLKGLYGLVNKRRPEGLAPEDAAVIAELDEQFRPCNDELSEIAGLDLSCWR
jgi:hypothetical protein